MPSTRRRDRMSLPQTCETAVPSPSDVVPIRSPQAVHSFVAARVAGKSLVEIGTRNGDGMNCFTLHAKQATAIEISEPYCRSLERRSAQIEAAHPGHGYKVTCADYRTGGVLDADVITWWEQYPLENVPGLRHLLREQRAGRIRQEAEAILLFDPKWFMDLEGWERLCPLAAWSAQIPFNERPRCLRSRGIPRGGVEKCTEPRRCPETCERAHGYFIVAGIPVSRVEKLGSITSAERKECIARHNAGHASVTDPTAWKLYEETAGRSLAAVEGGGVAKVAMAADMQPGLGGGALALVGLALALGLATVASLAVRARNKRATTGPE
jgi:hypothetical protein